MDIYSIINEIKDTEDLFTDEQLEAFYTQMYENTMYYIINKDENRDEDEDKHNIYSKISECILKRKNDYLEAKYNEKVDDFKKDLESDLKKILKKDKHEKFEEFLDYVIEVSENAKQDMKKAITKPDSVIYKLFLNEYNTKYSFTWDQFKETKKLFEKNHPLTGENIYNLKKFLEGDDNIRGKIIGSTPFCKTAHTLSKSTIEKLEEKLNAMLG